MDYGVTKANSRAVLANGALETHNTDINRYM